MKKQSVTVKHDFECGYVSKDEYGLVRFNAHRYRLEISVTCPQRLVDNGIVISFDSLKQIISAQCPHNKFMYNIHDDAGSDIAKVIMNYSSDIYQVNYDITAERLCDALVSRIQSALDTYEPGVFVNNAILRENNISYVDWSI